MLEVSNVTKYYGKEAANRDVSFTLPEGTVSVLLGPNGAGKSTIIKAMAGFLRHQGRITIDGADSKSLEAKRLLGYLPEMPSLYPNLTVREHLEFVARAYRLTDYAARLEALLERFELFDKQKKFGDELSKGMQQKLSLCCALLHEPKYLLMDEPLIGLDPHAIRELKLLIEELRGQGRALLISTHIIDSVDMLWDQALIMHQGRILESASREELQQAGTTLEERFFALTEGGREDTP